jgi:hypothetical protein
MNRNKPVDRLTGNLVVAGYLPWHGTAETDGQWSRWNDEGNQPEAGGVFSAYWPSKGPYSSADETILQLQAEELRRAGVDLVIIFWNNVYPGERQRVEKIMEVFGSLGLKGFVGVDWDWKFPAGSPEAAQDMVKRQEEVMTRWAAPDSAWSSFWYRDPVSGLTPYMIYGSAGNLAFWDARVAEWKSKDATKGIFMLGMTSLDMALSAAFDGIFWTGSKQPDDRREVGMLLDILHVDNGMFFMGGVIAGFHFLKKGEEVHLDRQAGKLYHRKWSSLVDTRGRFGNEVEHVYVPFNDWGEGASIEPASALPPVRSDGTEYHSFSPLGEDAYLDLTRYWAQEFRTSRSVRRTEAGTPSGDGAGEGRP